MKTMSSYSIYSTLVEDIEAQWKTILGYDEDDENDKACSSNYEQMDDDSDEEGNTIDQWKTQGQKLKICCNTV